MRAFDGVPAGKVSSRRRFAWLALAACLCAAPAPAQTAAAPEIVEPTGNLKPEYSKNPNPSSRDLIETWRSANLAIAGKRVDQEKFEILLRRVAPGKVPRAFLQFQIFSAQLDPLAWAAQRCKGRSAPVELQIYYQWSPYLSAWVPLGARGEGDDDLCAQQTLWTADQIEQIVNPKPLPVPPTVSRAQVMTPAAGSPERAAIMDALRPRYESLFGAPIAFRIVKLRVAAGFAFAVVHPERPNGAAITQQVWTKALGKVCFQYPQSVEHEYWMKKEGAVWTIGLKNGMCADDSISQEGDLIGAPPQLVDLDAWPEREDFPLPE
jgi:hypothetical protein